MNQDRNYRRGKSEDGYSSANQSGSGQSNRGSNYSNRNGEKGYNRDGGGYNKRSSSYNQDNNRGNRSYNTNRDRDQRPYDDHPYNQNEQRSYSGRQRFDRDQSSAHSGNFRPSQSQESGSPGNRKKRPRIGEHINNNSDGNSKPYNKTSPGNSYNDKFRRPTRNNDGEKPYNPNNKYSQKKQFEYKEILTDPSQPLRLNKFLANAGICSRREADEYILAGVIKVNGEVITELGHKVFRTDTILFHDEPVTLEKKAYVLLNKPKNCVTTSSDPEERLTVMDLVKNACNERIYPVGRLDRNTTGVLLLTNDGELASKLTHPKFIKKKIYHVILDKPLTKADMQQIADGIELEDGKVNADAISYTKDDSKKEIGIEIHVGKNRIVRRIFDHLGYKVIKLDRVYFAGLTKKNLTRGRWRYLTQREVNMLKMGAFE